MASPGNQHCANCIDTPLFPINCATLRYSAVLAIARCLSACVCLLQAGIVTEKAAMTYRTCCSNRTSIYQGGYLHFYVSAHQHKMRWTEPILTANLCPYDAISHLRNVSKLLFTEIFTEIQIVSV